MGLRALEDVHAEHVVPRGERLRAQCLARCVHHAGIEGSDLAHAGHGRQTEGLNRAQLHQVGCGSTLARPGRAEVPVEQCVGVAGGAEARANLIRAKPGLLDSLAQQLGEAGVLQQLLHLGAGRKLGILSGAKSRCTKQPAEHENQGE